MATGYTHDVADGKIKDFRTFALRCARAFGALIEMRDDPMDAPIPAEFKATDYHQKAIAEAVEKQKVLVAMTETERRAAYSREMEESWTRYSETKAEYLKTERRYREMLRKVQAWNPPSPEHKGLKDFMVEQLESSIKWDCGSVPKPEQPTLDQWWADKVARAARDIGYHRKEHAEEVERVKGRNLWVKQLNDSLASDA